MTALEMPSVDWFAAIALTSLGALTAIWIGYPLVMRLRAIGRRWSPSDDASQSDLPGGHPRVSVILATRDGAMAARSRIHDVLRTTYPAELLEILVGADAASLDVPEWRGLAEDRVRVVLADRPGGKAAALNAAVRAARGHVLVFMDTNQRFHPDAIARLATALSDSRFGAVTGVLDLGDEAGPKTPAERYWTYERWLRRNEAAVHSTVGVTGAIYAMPRSLWKPLPTGLILDDLYTPMRLVLDGYRVGVVEGARARDLRRATVEQEFRRKVRTLTGVIQLCAWLPAVLVPFRNPIWLSFVFHKLLRFLSPLLLLGVAVGFAGMLIIAAGNAAVWLTLASSAALLVVLARPSIRQRAFDLCRWGLTLHAAVIVAAYNGVRGRWDVWHR